MDDAVPPGPKASLVVTLQVACLMVLIRGKVGPMVVAPIENPEGTLVEKH